MKYSRAWAQIVCFSFSVGILCTVLGAVLEKQTEYAAVVRRMLDQGRSFMSSVLVRVEAEKPDNKDWATVHLSVLVNQALGALVETRSDFSEAPSLWGSYSTTNTHFRITESIKAYSQFFKFEDLMEFFYSLQPLLSRSYCAGAA